MRASVRAPATVHPLPGGEAIVAAPAAGRLRADVLLSIGDRVRTGQVLAFLEPRLSAGTDRATLAADVAEAQAALEAAQRRAGASRTTAGRTRCSRPSSRRCAPRGVGRRRAAAARPRRAWRSETRRCALAAAPPRATPSPCAHRSTDASRRSWPRSALPMTKVRRFSGSFAPIASNWKFRCRRPTPRLPDRPPDWRWRSRACPTPLVLEPHHVHDAGVIDPKTRALPLQMEIRESWRTVARRADRDRRVVYARADSSPSRSRVQPCSWKRDDHMCSSRSAASNLPGVSWTLPHATVMSSASGRGVKPGERVVTRGAYEVQLASAAKGLPAEGHVH